MARKKYKLTGFAKFIFVMIILVPIAYLSAVYINEGEDGLSNLFNEGSKEKTTITTESGKSKRALEKENQMLKDSIRDLNLDYQELKRQYRLLENNQSGQ